MSSLLLALTLMAWPPARGATPLDLADAGSWPNEPEWNEAWPLYAFTPPGWSLSGAEADAGVGMAVDRAWSITRGDPRVVLGIIAAGHELGDPVLARAWRLNEGELPDAGDTNGNGRLDVEDFASDPRVSDVNGNGALDLEDVVSALSDGLDQDGNGRADDVCGWDVVLNAPARSTADAGPGAFRLLAAPVNDGRPGIGACPECTLLPIAADARRLGAAIDFAVDAGVRALLLPRTDQELTASLQASITRARERVLLVTPGGGSLRIAPLSLELGVVTPRTLSASSTRDTARSREGCDGRALPGDLSVSATACGDEAAARLVGIAGLAWSVQPTLTPMQVRGLLGGPRVDAYRAVSLAEGSVPDAVGALPQLVPAGLGGSVESGATACAIEVDDVETPTDCAMPGPWRAGASLQSMVSRFVQRRAASSWSTAVIGPVSTVLSTQPMGAGSGPPLYVDLDGLGSESVLVSSTLGLLSVEPRSFSVASADALENGRQRLVVGDVDSDGVLDVVHVGEDAALRVFSFSGKQVAGYPEALPVPLAGAPAIVETRGGSALVTLDVAGRFVFRLGGQRWTLELGARQVSSPAAGRIDGDAFADFAIADGIELRVIFTDVGGPTSAGWSVATRAPQAMLANLAGDAELEIVADAVYDARGERLLELDGWQPPAFPPAIARLGKDARRSLVQVERSAGGQLELARYDLEAALRTGDRLVARQLLFALPHPPSPGGFSIADVDGDRAPDVILPTEDGRLYVIQGTGEPGRDSPSPIPGSVFSGPAVGVADQQLQYAVRTTRGDLVRWLSRGIPEDISWEVPGHDRGNTWNAETPLPPRRLAGLGVMDPNLGGSDCGCTATEGLGGLCLLFLFRRRRHTC